MNFHIADTFTASFNRLSGQDQKAVKASVFDLQIDPTGNGLQLHRIDKCKDDHFWSARVNRDVRLIVHKTASSMLVAYVDHHDDAYAWAQRRRIEAHPTTGAIQIVEVRELVESVAWPETFDFVAPAPVAPAKAEPAKLFAALDDDDLLSIGVPGDWTADVRAATEDGFFALAVHSFALVVHDIVVFQQMFADIIVARFNFLLCLFKGAIDPRVDNSFSLLKAKLFKPRIKAFGAKNTHQVIFKA